MDNNLQLDLEQFNKLSEQFLSHGQTILIRRSTDSGMPIEYISSNVLKNLGYESDELVTSQHSYLKLIHMDDLLAFQDALLNLSSSDKNNYEQEYRLQHANGEYVWFKDVITPVVDDSGKIVSYNGCLENVSRLKQAEITIKRFRLFDSLTNLPNRFTLTSKLDEYISEARTRRLFGCVITINLDRFKFINNNYGFDVGDKLLKEVARRLKKSIRPQDIVARINADEFVCVITDINKNKETVIKIATKTTDKIREIIANKYNIADMTLKINASCGICLYPEDNQNANDILKFSDIALNNAKRSGQNNVHFFDEKMHQKNTLHTNLEHDLVQAITKKELELYFQPIVNNDRNIIAFESLLRWKHPDKGDISPSEFIPIAESTGLLQQLGEYVIERACEQLALWEKENVVSDGRIKYLSVNVSPNQFWHTDFSEHLFMNIQSKGIDPKHLLIEITENIFIADLQEAIDKINQLKQFGLNIALDDFGSGYSSLSYLMQLPIDIIKLDRAFIQNVHKDEVKATIIKSVCEIAKKLKLKVIAEGLETVEELETLVKYDCDAYQGFYFYRPAPVSELEKLLQKKPETGFNDFNNTTELPIRAKSF